MRQAQQRAWRLAQLRAELGDLADRTFDDFEVKQRPLKPLEYRGVTYPTGTQRRTLAEARAASLAYASTLVDAVEPSPWFFCYGPVGGGKSHLAAAIANHAVAMGLVVSYASVPRFLRFIKSGFRQISDDSGSSEADARIQALMDVPILVLDDLGQEQRLSPWDRTMLFELFDARYRKRLPTVITSNLNLEDLERVHEPVADRIRGLTINTRIPLIVSSIRGEGKEGSVRAS
jgi:DNA replication protein DnaC